MGEEFVNDVRDSMHVVTLDFEGLAPEKGVYSERDRKMFALAILLSSSIFFNSKTDFTTEKMMEVSIIEDIFRKIKINDQDISSATPDGSKGQRDRVSTSELNKLQT